MRTGLAMGGRYQVVTEAVNRKLTFEDVTPMFSRVELQPNPHYWTSGTPSARLYFTTARILFSICR